jgi:chemotaxis protein methyltransferase CheR
LSPLAGYPLTETVFVILRDLIEERTGVQFDDSKRELLAERLSRRVAAHGFDSFLDFYYLLKYGPDAAAEWKQVQDALSVQETYFWREMDQIKALVECLVPQFAQRAKIQPLRIWSAGCATGEEPLTIAMALNESGWFDRMPIEILATDASSRALEKARRGVFGERSFRNLPPALRDKYFSNTPNGWQISPELHARIGWSQANMLAPEELEANATAPIIVCRNVFIYFSPPAILRVVNFLASRMPTPAYLLLGAAESLMALTTSFELEQTSGAFWYVKR